MEAHSMRVLSRPLAVLTGSLVLLSSTATLGQSSPSVQPGTSPGAQPPALEGTVWTLVEVDSGGTLTPVPEGVEATLILDDGQGGGSGGCNRFGGAYALDGDSLTFAGVTTTEMACEEPRMTVEGAYYDALSRVTSWAIEDGRLTLSDTDGRALLRYEVAPGAPLVGVVWSLTGYIDDSGTLHPPAPGGTPATIAFDAAGQASGSTGCNSFSGPYTVDGNAIQIGPLSTTLMMCAEPHGSQEVAVLGALDRVRQFWVSADALELQDETGTTLLAYASAAPIEEVAWVLTILPGGAPVADGTFTTLLLADGQLSGNAPCNTYSGAYTLEGTTINVSSIVRTKMACPALEQEDAYLTALADVASYTIDGDTLVLAGADGTALLGFARVQR
jgi:heat shock protein HslJ